VIFLNFFSTAHETSAFFMNIDFLQKSWQCSECGHQNE